MSTSGTFKHEVPLEGWIRSEHHLLLTMCKQPGWHSKVMTDICLNDTQTEITFSCSLRHSWSSTLQVASTSDLKNVQMVLIGIETANEKMEFDYFIIG